MKIMEIEKIPFTKFQDGKTRMELDHKMLSTIALALAADANNEKCSPDHRDYCYQLGRDFMRIWQAEPEPTPFDNL